MPLTRTSSSLASLLLLLAACASGGGSPDGGRFGGDGAAPDGGPADEDAGLPDASVDAPPSDDCAGQPEGTPCDADGDGCTQDLCRRGRCTLGGASDCDDGVSCTTDVCISTGAMSFRCENEIAGGCYIEGVCRDEGARNPEEDCQLCDAAAPTAWSTATDVSCDDGDACTSDDRCADGTCTGTPVLDDYEMNDGRAAAHDLGNISDGDSFPAGTFSATLFPEGDVDWFVYNDSDDSFSSIFPRVQLRDLPSGSNYDLCVFIDCESSFNSRDCRAGTPVTEGGLSGCCSTNDGNADENVRIDHDCSGVDDSADVYFRVEKVAGPATCDAPYTIRWGDD